MENKTFTVAVLGAGNIGSAVLSRLESLDNDVLNLELKMHKKNHSLVKASYFN